MPGHLLRPVFHLPTAGQLSAEDGWLLHELHVGQGLYGTRHRTHPIAGHVCMVCTLHHAYDIHIYILLIHTDLLRESSYICMLYIHIHTYIQGIKATVYF